MKLLDRLPLLPLIAISVLLGLAPFIPEPHLVEKLKMLVNGHLNRPVDMFDLLLHGGPLLILMLKIIRISSKK